MFHTCSLTRAVAQCLPADMQKSTQKLLPMHQVEKTHAQQATPPHSGCMISAHILSLHALMQISTNPPGVSVDCIWHPPLKPSDDPGFRMVRTRTRQGSHHHPQEDHMR